MEQATEQNQIVKAAVECGLAENHPLVMAFMPSYLDAVPLVQKASGITITDATQVKEMALAKRIRLDLAKIRNAAEKIRVGLKADALKTGRDIDAVARALTMAIKPEEDRLEQQETFAVRAQEKRLAELAASRRTLLAPYNVDTTYTDLKSMTDLVFSSMLDSARLAHEAKLEREAKSRADAEAAESARKAEQASKDAELARLRLETVAKDKAAADERRAAAEAARVAEESARKKQEAIQAKADAEMAAITAANLKASIAAEAKAKSEREAREAAEKKLRDAAEAKRKEEVAAEKARLKAERAPDADKIRAIAAAVRAIPTPNVAESSRGHLLPVMNALAEMCDWIEAQAADLETR